MDEDAPRELHPPQGQGAKAPQVPREGPSSRSTGPLPGPHERFAETIAVDELLRLFPDEDACYRWLEAVPVHTPTRERPTSRS